jgi:hypothetical protein
MKDYFFEFNTGTCSHAEYQLVNFKHMQAARIMSQYHTVMNKTNLKYMA